MKTLQDEGNLKKKIDMIDPESKDYIVGKLIRDKMLSPRERMERRLNLMRANRQRITADTKTRKEGETISQWRKRTKR